MSDDTHPVDPSKLGDLTHVNFDLREQKRELERQVREINVRIKEYEFEIQRILEHIGVKKIGVEGINISMSTEIQPSVQDWDEVYSYIRESGDFHLLHRRFSAGPYRELLEAGVAIPGVEPTEIVKISMRKVAE